MSEDEGHNYDSLRHGYLLQLSLKGGNYSFLCDYVL